jgi:Ca2+-binding RTX toxin-like protein
MSYYAESTSPKHLLSISCCLGGNDKIYGGAGDVDYLIGGGFNDTIEGNDGMDLVFGDHAFLTFYETESHRLRYATTTNHSCSGGDDTINLGAGDVRSSYLLLLSTVAGARLRLS